MVTVMISYQYRAKQLPFNYSKQFTTLLFLSFQSVLIRNSSEKSNYIEMCIEADTFDANYFSLKLIYVFTE